MHFVEQPEENGFSESHLERLCAFEARCLLRRGTRLGDLRPEPWMFPESKSENIIAIRASFPLKVLYCPIVTSGRNRGTLQCDKKWQLLVDGPPKLFSFRFARPTESGKGGRPHFDWRGVRFVKIQEDKKHTNWTKPETQLTFFLVDRPLSCLAAQGSVDLTFN